MHGVRVARAALPAFALLISWASWSSLAVAQAITAQILEFEGRDSTTGSLQDLASTMASPIGIAECDATITFRFSNVDTSRNALEWFEGGNCNDPAVRQDLTTTTCRELAVQPTSINRGSQVEVDVLVRDMIPECESATGSKTLNVWVLALSNPSDEVSGAGQQVNFPIAFDFDVPTAPSNVQAKPGEVAAEVTWSAQTGVREYQVFVDPMGCTDGEVTSEGLLSEPPDTSLLVSDLRPAGTSDRTMVTFPDSVPFGSEIAIGIRAVDFASNTGELATVCVERIETVSWWDMMCPPGATAEVCTSNGCAASPGRASNSGAAFALAAALLALIGRRRSR
jgi:hypothetical protein